MTETIKPVSFSVSILSSLSETIIFIHAGGDLVMMSSSWRFYRLSTLSHNHKQVDGEKKGWEG